MAAAPVRQRSGSAGPRTQLPPCYYEGYLEKRGPKEKVGSLGARPPARSHTIHTFQCHVVSAAGVINIGVGGQCVCATPDDPRFPESCQLPHCARAAEAEGWRYRWNADLYTWQPENVHHPKCVRRKESWVCPRSTSLRLSHACPNPGLIWNEIMTQGLRQFPFLHMTNCVCPMCVLSRFKQKCCGRFLQNAVAFRIHVYRLNYWLRHIFIAK